MDLCAACVRSIRIIRLRAQNKASALRSHLCWLFIIFAWSRFQRHLAQRFCQRVSTPANLSTSDDPDLRFLSFVFKDARGQGGGSLRPHGALGENAHSGRFHRLGRSGPDPRNDQPDSRIWKNGDHQRKIAGRTDTVGRTAGRLLPDRRSPMGGLAGGRLSRAMTSGCEARILRSSKMMVCRKNVARPARTLHLSLGSTRLWRWNIDKMWQAFLLDRRNAPRRRAWIRRSRRTRSSRRWPEKRTPSRRAIRSDGGRARSAA